MQKIFYNAKIETIDEKASNAEAFLVNDENIVFVGSNEEVLEMKQENTEIIDLQKAYVYPTFFDTNASIYQMIEDNLKSAKLENKVGYKSQNNLSLKTGLTEVVITGCSQFVKDCEIDIKAVCNIQKITYLEGEKNVEILGVVAE